MKKRSIAGVLLLPFITFGIYGLVWLIDTKEEMKRKGADIPSALLLIIPIGNIIWFWKYSKGVEHVTSGQSGAGGTFCLLLFLGPIGAAVTQSAFNKISA